MKDRTLLLAALIEEDDIENVRHSVVESYEEQFEEDRKFISENISFVEEDDLRLIRMIGEQEEIPEWEGGKMLNEGTPIGGSGFVGSPSYALSSRYSPSQSEIMGQIVNGGYHRDSGWKDLDSPKIKLFQKIAESNPGAFGMSSIREEELPEFDENFNPILSEMGQVMSPREHHKSVMDQFNSGPGIDPDEYPEINGLEGPFNMKGRILYYDPKEGQYYDRKTDMYIDHSELSSLMEGETMVQGGIGPGFQAFDGFKKEVVNPYKNASDAMSRWYLGEANNKDFEDDGNSAEDIIDIGYQDEVEIIDYPNNLRFGDTLLKKVGKIGPTKYHTGDGIGYEVVYKIVSSEKNKDLRFQIWLDDDDYFNVDVVDPINFRFITNGFGDTPKDAIQSVIQKFHEPIMEMKEINYFEDEDEDEDESMVPNVIRVNDVILTYMGKDRNEEDFHLYKDDFGEVFGLAKDVDGWYAAARSDWGTQAEGFGDTPEDAMRELVIEFYGEELLSESLLETVEGTDGNYWFYRRTGTPGGYNVKYRENDTPTMHPKSPEEPSSKGHPGLTGWQFYDADHTQQKTKSQMEDPLDDGEATATEEVFMKFLKKHSVYGK